MLASHRDSGPGVVEDKHGDSAGTDRDLSDEKTLGPVEGQYMHGPLLPWEARRQSHCSTCEMSRSIAACDPTGLGDRSLG